MVKVDKSILIERHFANKYKTIMDGLKTPNIDVNTGVSTKSFEKVYNDDQIVRVFNNKTTCKQYSNKMMIDVLVTKAKGGMIKHLTK